MPRIDSVTGVPVMTLPEFFAAEARSEGKGRTGGEVMAEMFDEIGQEEEAHAKRISEPGPNGQYDQARDILQRCMHDNEDPETPYGYTVLRVRSVRDSYASFGGRSTKEGFVAEVECSDGRVRTLRYFSDDYSGGMSGPPEHESGIREIVATPKRSKHRCPKCKRPGWRRKNCLPTDAYLCMRCDIEWL